MGRDSPDDERALAEKLIKIEGVQELHDQFKGLLRGLEAHAERRKDAVGGTTPTIRSK